MASTRYVRKVKNVRRLIIMVFHVILINKVLYIFSIYIYIYVFQYVRRMMTAETATSAAMVLTTE